MPKSLPHDSHATTRVPLHHATRGPPPRSGEELGADDPTSNFAAIGDEEGFDHAKRHQQIFCMPKFLFQAGLAATK